MKYYSNDNKNSGDRVFIKKASGELEEFSVAKLGNSLKNSGADAKLQNEIINHICGWIYDGISTKQIYKRAYQLLRQKKILSSLRYKLKQAMLELGPTGFPFEKIVGLIFDRQGYKTEVGKVIDGFCVSHEMDVIATNTNHQCLAECKYSYDKGKKISIQTPLYVRSRIDDIVKYRKTLPEYKDFTFSAWIFTNTKFSDDSMNYAKCSGLKLIGWDYPDGKGLKELMEENNIFPVTILNHLKKIEKEYLISRNIVVCAQLIDNLEILKSFEMSENKYNLLLRELNTIKDIKNSDINSLEEK